MTGRGPGLSGPARAVRAYVRGVGRPVSVRAALTGAGLEPAEGFRALAILLERAELTMRRDAQLGEMVQAVGAWGR